MRFQSTLPREERPLQHQLGLHRRIFQSTLPREERRAKRTCLPKEPSDFNPRSHERSDPQPTPLVCPPTFISIHAPTRGATQGVIDLHSGLYDFNPRSHERSDKEHGVIEADHENFNPRSHERSDCKCSTINAISTYFNPRSHERSDAENETEIAVLKISIHAPTRGATQHQPRCSRARNFNPRSHERSDLATQKLPLPHRYFNPRSHERSDREEVY